MPLPKNKLFELGDAAFEDPTALNSALPAENPIFAKSLEERAGLIEGQQLGTLKTWGDTISELVIEQLDPINLALLVASFPAGKIAFNATAKLLGSATIGGHAVKIAPHMLTTAGEAVARTSNKWLPGAQILPELARGAGMTAPFAAAELIEEPEEGSTRLGEASSMLAFNMILDAGLVGLGIPFRWIGTAKREAQRTMAHSLAEGATEARAAADAFVAKINTLRAYNVPDDILDKLIGQAKTGMNVDTPTLLQSLLTQHAAPVASAAQKLGLSPEQVTEGFREMIEESTAASTLARWVNEQKDNVFRAAQPGVLDLLSTDAARAAKVDVDLTTIFDAPPTSPFPIQVTAAIKRLVKHGFDEKLLREIRLKRIDPTARAETDAARASFQQTLEKMKPPKKKVTPEQREAGLQAFSTAFSRGAKAAEPPPKVPAKTRREGFREFRKAFEAGEAAEK